MGGAAASAPAAALPAASNPLILRASDRFRSSFMHIRDRALHCGCLPSCIVPPHPPRATGSKHTTALPVWNFRIKAFIYAPKA